MSCPHHKKVIVVKLRPGQKAIIVCKHKKRRRHC